MGVEVVQSGANRGPMRCLDCDTDICTARPKVASSCHSCTSARTSSPRPSRPLPYQRPGASDPEEAFAGALSDPVGVVPPPMQTEAASLVAGLITSRIEKTE
jgi:hypothetical protein